MMPHAPRSPCMLPGCNSTTTRHGYCAKHQRHTYDARRGTASDRGYDPEWAAESKSYRKAIGNQCEIHVRGVRCLGVCAIVHHIESVEKAPARRLDPTNRVGLCASHHGLATKHQEATGNSPAWCTTRRIL